MKKRGRSPKEAKQAGEAVGDGYGEGEGDIKNRFRGVRMRHSGKFSAEFRMRHLGTFNSAEEAACAYDMAAVSYVRPTAITNFPLPPNSSYPQDPNPNFSSEPCLQDQHQILRPHMPDVISFSTVESISDHIPQLEQSISLRKATPIAQNQTFMDQSSVPEPATNILEHQKSLNDEHHKKKKSKQQDSQPDHEMASQQRLASVEVRPDTGVEASAKGSTGQGGLVPSPSICNFGHVDPLEISGANIMHSTDHYCPNWSLEINDRACEARVVTEPNEGSVLPRDKILALNLPDEILHEQRSKELETKLRKLEAELELCKSELSQSKTELEEKKIEMEIELGAAEYAMEARHQAVLNEVEAKHKAALSEAAEVAVQDFKRSEACENDLVVMIAPAYGMGFTEALDLAKNSGASIDLSQEAFARAYKPGLREELTQRVALFKQGKDLSELYQIAGQAEEVVPERSDPSGD